MQEFSKLVEKVAGECKVLRKSLKYFSFLA